MRSLLLVDGDDEAALAAAPASWAEIVAINLTGESDAARVAAFVAANRAAARIYVCVSPLGSGFVDADLDAILPARPAGIVPTFATGGPDLIRVSAMLAAREALAGIEDGATRILALVERPAALLRLASFADATRRLAGIAWDARGLSDAFGAPASRDDAGRLTDACRTARALCLAAAASAGVPAIDTAFPGASVSAFEAEALAAAREGFAGKVVLGREQAAVANRVFAR